MLKNPYGKLAVAVVDPALHRIDLVIQMLRALAIRNFDAAANAADAQKLLGGRRFNVIMLDDATGKWDGIEFTGALRANANGPNHATAVIMMSAAPDAARIKAARDAGVTEFLRRPFSAQHIEARLKSILEAPRDFIAVESYVGPDRRRHHDDYGGDERRDVDAPPES